MERTEVNVTAKISFHDVLNALALLANVYPMERVAEYQIERIEASARILRERMQDYEEKKNVSAESLKHDLKVAMEGIEGLVALPPGAVPMAYDTVLPSGWSYSIQFDKGNSAPAVTVLDRRVGSPSTRRTYNACGSPSRRTGKGRREGDVGYSTLPYSNCSICYEEFHSYSCVRPSHGVPTYKERRIRGERRKVQDASSKYLRRTLNMFGRRRTDNTQYSTYPVVNAFEPVMSKAHVNIERRANTADRRKVNDWAHPNRSKRVAGYGPKGRRSTDRESYTVLPNINTRQ